MDSRVILAQHAAERSAMAVHQRMSRGLRGLATVAATAPFLGMAATCWGMLNSFPGCGGEKSTCMAAVTALLSASIAPAALGLAVAIIARWGYASLSRQMAQFDTDMRSAVRDLTGLPGGIGPQNRLT